MKKSIAILTDVYYPHPMAGGICAHQLAKGLRDRGYKVHIICYKRKGEKDEVIDGIQIHRIKMPLVNIIRDCSERIQSQFLSKIIYNIAIILNRIIKIVYLKWYPLKSPILIFRYIACVKKLDVDAVVGEFYSVESAYAASILKSKYKKKLVLYNVDSLSNCDPAVGLSLKYVRNKGMEWEARLFKNADCIVVMKCHEDHYRSGAFFQYSDRIKVLDLPLMEIPREVEENDDCKNKGNNILWIYTGSLSHAIRTPDYLLEIVENFPLPIKIHFFSKGDCESVINEAAQKYGDRIIQHGHIPKEELEKSYREADFLISIGNFLGDFLPSKTIEYIAHCKPIIHLCYQEKDASIPYLERYGHALIIRVYEGSIDEHIMKIREFVDYYIHNHITISVHEVKKQYIENTPDYTAEVIDNMLSQ